MHQFSIAFDVYANILSQVEIAIEKALLCDEADYCIKHACPCCMYELQGKMKLIYCLLFCMDSNDSLKHILWQSGDEEEGWKSKESIDDWDSGRDYFLS